MIVHVSANTDCTYLYCLLLQWGFGDTEPHNLKVMLSMAPEAEFLAAKNQIDHAKVSIDCIRLFFLSDDRFEVEWNHFQRQFNGMRQYTARLRMIQF